MGRAIALFDDPHGERWGFPTYPFKLAPAHLVTRRQLRARGLCPGGHDPVAQMLWHDKRGGRHNRPGIACAWLYDIRLAKPSRVSTERQREALEKAMKARRTCSKCGVVEDYCLPVKYGRTCIRCGDWGLDPAVYRDQGAA